MQTENYIIVWEHYRQNNKGNTNGIYSNNHIIIVGSELLHMDEYKSSNRILPEGYETDRVKATQDIQKYGKQYYYEQHIAGKYDIKEAIGVNLWWL